MGTPIGLLIEDHISFRAWVDSRNLLSLAACPEITLKIFANPALQVSKFLKENRIDNSKFKIVDLEIRKQPRLWDIFHVAILIKYRKKSISFQSRLNRLIYGFCNIELTRLKKIKIIISKFKITIFYLVPLNNFFVLMAYLFLKIYNPIIKKENFQDLEYILFSSSTFEWYVQPLISMLKKMKIKSVMCVDNWDNISSKTILLIKPDFMTVFGEHSKRDAINIQGLEPTKVFAIGTPRFDEYRRIISKKRSQKISTKKFSVLYLGGSLPHAEKLILLKLIRSNGNFLKKNKINLIYKPHPFSAERCFDILDNELEHAGVKILTPQNRIKISNSDDVGYPTMHGKYLDMFLEYSCVISAPTTAALESLIVGRPTIIDVIDDGIHSSTAARTINNYEHFKEFKKIKNLHFANTIQKLFEFIKDTNKGNISYVKYDLSDLICIDKNTFSYRLLSALNIKNFSN